MAVKLCETVLRSISADLPEDLILPDFYVIDFGKYNFKPDVIGAHDRSTGNIFINAHYKTKNSILAYLNKEKGLFANTSIESPYLHEIGHHYYQTILEQVARKRNTSYNVVKEEFEEEIKRYFCPSKVFWDEEVVHLVGKYAYNCCQFLKK